MNPKSISMLHKQITTYFKVKYKYILIDIINHMGSVIGKSYGLL